MATNRTTPNRITAAINTEREQALHKVRWVGIPLALIATVICPIGIIAWVGIWISCYQSANRTGSAIKIKGAAGEDRVEGVLSRLPESYSVFNQIKLPCHSSSTGFLEADFVVVGPNGVFIVENKDYTGRVVGNEYDKDWTIYKIGRGGTAYSKTARNPVKQVRGYVRILSDIFSERGIKGWITPMVSLSRDNSTDLINSGNVPVLQASDLSDAILAHRGSTITAENKTRVLQVLEELRSGRLQGMERKAA
jgi:hypothetical protein